MIDHQLFASFIAVLRIIIPCIGLVLACLVLIVFQQYRTGQINRALDEELCIGAIVTTNDGLVGTICNMQENSIIVQLPDGRKKEITIQAVALVHHGTK